jgi:N-acetylneuraminate synthase
MSRDMFGPDVAASVTPAELRLICDGVRFIEKIQNSPIDKASINGDVAALRDIFFKSVVAAQDLPAGTVLTRAHLDLKKPGNGIPAAQLDAVIGKTLRHAIPRDIQLKFEDIQSS